MTRWVSPVVLAAFLSANVANIGCGGGNAASQVAKTPELPTDKQTKCRVAKSQAEPLIVEWPDAARGRLESMSKRGLVAVRYEGCELEVLSRCTVKAPTYAYAPVTRKQSRVTIKDEDDLYANLPVGAIRLEGKLRTAGQLDVNMTIVGRYESPSAKVTHDQLEGECGNATHVIHALSVGAFTFSAGSDAQVGAGASAMGVGGGAKSSATRETLTRDGDEATCGRASTSDKTPPEGCGALLQIEVMPLSKQTKAAAAVVTTPAPVPPTPERPAPAAKTCPYGQHLEFDVCVDDTQAVAAVKEAPTTYSPYTPYGVNKPAETEMPNPMRWYLAYAAVGAGVIGIASGAGALKLADEATASCSSTTKSCSPNYDDQRSQAITYSWIANVSFGLAALATIGIFLVPSKVKVGGTASSNGVSVGASGSF